MFVYAVGYTMDVMYFSWLSNAVEIDKDIELPQFKLRQTILFECSQNYTGGTHIRHTHTHITHTYITLHTNTHTRHMHRCTPTLYNQHYQAAFGKKSSPKNDMMEICGVGTV